MAMKGRRALAIWGGALFGFATGSAMTTVFEASSGSGLAFGGMFAGVGLGLMVAATLRE